MMYLLGTVQIVAIFEILKKMEPVVVSAEPRLVFAANVIHIIYENLMKMGIVSAAYVEIS
jgi:hypothetical protein